MIGLYIICLIMGAEILCLIFFNQLWVRAGLIASIILGLISFVILGAAMYNGNEENFVMDSFFVLNMLLPLLFSIEIYMFTQPKPAKKKK